MDSFATKTTAISTLICRECNEHINECDNCSQSFKEDEEIYCVFSYSDPNNHFCLDCRKYENVLGAKYGRH